MKKKIIILIPAFNEEKTISRVIQKIPNLKEFEKEIVVIDDGSKDSTVRNALKAGAKVISNNKNRGLGYSFKKGLEFAIRNGGDIIVNLDADDQYDPKYIPLMIRRLINKDLNLILGNRLLDDKEIGHNILKRYGNKVISIFISKVLLRCDEVYDIQSGFRVFDRKLAKFLLFYLSAKYTYTQEMMILSILKEFKIDQIPIRFKKRTQGSSRLIRSPIVYLLKIILIIGKTFIFFKPRFKKYS
ncbi:MAG: glycosyltransferase family 2 protein [Nanoarchaeota archaeon]